jgi:hypothetical protein
LGTDSTPRPTLVVNPADDDGFRSFAVDLIDRGVGSPFELQERLRRRHPAAIVRPRELAGEHAEIWYVYREGHWIRSGASTTPPGGIRGPVPATPSAGRAPARDMSTSRRA